MARTGAEIYRNFQDGQGTGGLADAAAMVKAVADECAEDADAIRRLTAKMEASWQGEAAGAARRGAPPLATEHQSAATGLADVEMVATAEVDFFGSAKNSVVPVPPKPAEPSQWAGFVDLAEQYERYEDQLDAHNAAARHNVAVMDGYAGDSGTVAQQLPREYGNLASGPADVTAGRDSTLDGDESDRSVSATEWLRTAGEPSAGDSALGDAMPVDGRQPGGPSEPGGAPTTPDSYAPSSPTPVPPGGDLGSVPRPTPVSPGLGLVGVPWAGTDGPRDGMGGRGGTSGRGGPAGVGPREGAALREAPVPRDGALSREGLREGSPRSGVSESHAGARSGAAVVGGRGGVATHGVPVGAPGRGRDDEDVEHRCPAFLEGDDPEELFGSAVLTAPPTIGAEDED